MILTGKTREDFINYLWKSNFKKEYFKEYEDYIDNQKESHTYADIIDWFDSVGVYIEVKKSHSIYWMYDITIEDSRLLISVLDPMQESRQEATRQAIIKANETYDK